MNDNGALRHQGGERRTGRVPPDGGYFFGFFSRHASYSGRAASESG